jgi:cytochrome c556
MTLRLTLAGAAFAALLAACNAEAPDTAATPSEVETAAAPAEEHGAAVAANPSSQEIIETRQKHLKEMGAAMKTIGDNLKSGSPSLETIRPAVATLNGHAPNLASWFPAGAGPEAGVKTEALAKIWEDAPGFQAAAKSYSFLRR